MIDSIEIQFPGPVDLPNEFEQSLHELLGSVCKKFMKNNKDRKMWVSESGSKMLSNPYLLGDGEPLKFDDSTLFIGVSVK